MMGQFQLFADVFKGEGYQAFCKYKQAFLHKSFYFEV